jgi:hypothetical protein
VFNAEARLLPRGSLSRSRDQGLIGDELRSVRGDLGELGLLIFGHWRAEKVEATLGDVGRGAVGLPRRAATGEAKDLVVRPRRFGTASTICGGTGARGRRPNSRGDCEKRADTLSATASHKDRAQAGRRLFRVRCAVVDRLKRADTGPDPAQTPGQGLAYS